MCYNLESISLPSSLLSIGRYAFYECNKLKTISLPENLSTIGDNAFDGCYSITSFSFPKSLTSIGFSAFNGCAGLTSLSFPNGLISIGGFAFCSCSNLTSIYIPESVTSIGCRAFYYNCKALTSITCMAVEPPQLLDSEYDFTDIFENFDKTQGELYVPAGSVEKYRKDAQWTGFKKYIEIFPNLNVTISGEGEILLSGNAVENGSSFERESFDFIVLPADGYVIESATLDGEDVLGQIVNHHLVISGLKADATLSVVFTPVAEPELATLRVKNGEMHAMTHRYVAGNDVHIELHPDEGWTVHSVTVNDEDVTDHLDGNFLVLPALQGENTMNVVYTSTTATEITDVEAANPLRVSVKRNTLTVTGKADSDIVEVHDTDGRALYIGRESTVELPAAQGVVIVRVSNQTFKGIIR